MTHFAIDNVLKMSSQERCTCILDAFDEWLAIKVHQLGLKYEDLPRLNDAFRSYFEGMSTLRASVGPAGGSADPVQPTTRTPP